MVNRIIDGTSGAGKVGAWLSEAQWEDLVTNDPKLKQWKVICAFLKYQPTYKRVHTLSVLIYCFFT